MTPTIPSFLTALPRGLARSFSARNLAWHLLAWVTTAAIVLTGIDWSYFASTRFVPDSVYMPAVVLGGALPILVPATLLITGYLRRREAVKRVGFALGQAALLAVVISSTYKALTGRVEPPLGAALVDNSHAFHFGFFEYGIFWGWPSGHTTTAFAMAVTLIVLLRPRPAVAALLAAYAAYIGLSVSISIHWLSDFTAGMIIGTVIGVVTGTMWRAQAPTPEARRA